MTDPDIERLLKEALNVPPPREHRLEMLRAAVEREWRSAIAEPGVISVRRRVVRRGLAAAAAVGGGGGDGLGRAIPVAHRIAWIDVAA